MIQLPSMDTDNLLSLLHLLPVGIFLVNREDRIIWVNKTLCEQTGLEARQLIGHMRSELPGNNIFPLTEQVARHHMSSPQNAGLFNFNYICRQLHREFQDVAEIGCLVKFNKMFDEQIQFGFEQVDDQTGLYTRHGILKKLSLHVSRSRRYHNPLSMIMLRINPETSANQESINHAISRILRDKLRWVDDVGHWNMTDFLLILPETSEESAHKLARKIKFQINRFKLPQNQARIPTTIAVTAWKKGADENSLLKDLAEQLKTSDYEQASSTTRTS